MSKKQNLKNCLSVNITAVDHDGNIADSDLTVKEFLTYMESLQTSDCNQLACFTVTFLSIPVAAEALNTHNLVQA